MDSNQDGGKNKISVTEAKNDAKNAEPVENTKNAEPVENATPVGNTKNAESNAKNAEDPEGAKAPCAHGSLQIAKAFSAHPFYPFFKDVQQKLAAQNFVCWVAGGAVRDFLLGRKVSDFDLVTDATTEQILQIFPKALTVGASFGVVKLAIPTNLNHFFDLATFRRESDYVDGRRPSQVDFATPKEDAFRRDFTVNAIFWDDEKKRVVDYTGGLIDLENKILRCVGNAEVRFQEDHLRILRLLRFAVQLNFSFEEATLQAAQKRISLLQKISGERIWAELEKIALSANWSSFFTVPLAPQIFDFIFAEGQVSQAPLSQEVTAQLDQIQNFHLLKFFFILLHRYQGQNVESILKSRLKVGRLELQKLAELKNIVFSFKETNFGSVKARSENSGSEISFAEWAYELEKKPNLFEILTFLTQLQIFKRDLFAKLEKAQTSPPAKLITGDDLMGKIEKEKMGSVLKQVRLMQFENPQMDKEQILNELVKKKFIHH